MAALQLHTGSLHPYSVQFSPFRPDRLAYCVCQHYGVGGVGAVYVFDLVDSQVPVQKLDWPRGIYDFCWSEDDESVLFAGSVDGSVVLWDFQRKDRPLIWKEHQKEVQHVDYSTNSSALLLTSSWDGRLGLVNVERFGSFNCCRFFSGHSSIVYCGKLSPLRLNIFASTSRDGQLRIWDVRESCDGSSSLVVDANQAEILYCDWCKYDENLLSTAGTDNSVKVWDLRHARQAVRTLRGHKYAVRCVKWSPFVRSQLVSCSYDFTVQIWDLVAIPPSNKPETPLETVRHHSEFVVGLDYSLHRAGLIADCSWDKIVKIYRPRSLFASKF